MKFKGLGCFSAICLGAGAHLGHKKLPLYLFESQAGAFVLCRHEPCSIGFRAFLSVAPIRKVERLVGKWT
jgi:hypothetical protein